MDILYIAQLLFSALVIGAVYAMIGLGLNLVYGTMRLLNIGHGDLIMIGAYTSFWLFALFELSPIISLAIAALGSSALGALFYFAIFRRQLKSTGPVEKLEANSLLLFFGLSVVMQNLASLFFSASPRAVPYLDQVLNIGGVSMTASRLLTLCISVTLCIAVVEPGRAGGVRRVTGCSTASGAGPAAHP